MPTNVSHPLRNDTQSPTELIMAKHHKTAENISPIPGERDYAHTAARTARRDRTPSASQSQS
jgi:hypothetical protein